MVIFQFPMVGTEGISSLQTMEQVVCADIIFWHSSGEIFSSHCSMNLVLSVSVGQVWVGFFPSLE